MALSPQMAEFLNELGHDAAHANDIGLAAAADADIADRARQEDRIVVTADLDFPHAREVDYCHRGRPHAHNASPAPASSVIRRRRATPSISHRLE
jgi:predicted nuclease of predicted toxin-antitoxin system